MEELKILMKDSGIENQILMQRLKRVQEECVLCKKYRRKKLKSGTYLLNERNINEIKRNIIYIMNEFSKMAVA